MFQDEDEILLRDVLWFGLEMKLRRGPVSARGCRQIRVRARGWSVTEARSITGFIFDEGVLRCACRHAPT